MVKKVSKNKTEKASSGSSSSKGSHAGKHLSPLARAYLKVVKASKQTQEVQTSMSPLLYREMMAGLNTEIKYEMKEADGTMTHGGLFRQSKPYFFADNVKLVYNTELRKLKKKIQPIQTDLTNLKYIAMSGIVKNEIDPVTNLFSPDYLGRKMHPASVALSRDRVLTGIETLSKADIDNVLTHRFLSLACNDKEEEVENYTVLERAIKEYFDALKLFDTEPTSPVNSPSENTSNQDKLRDAIKNCVKLISGITTVNSPFRHKSTSHDKINTSDYVISICCTSHEYETEKNTYGLMVHKKIIFASVKNPSDPQGIISHTPVCEELVIQYRKPENTGIKSSPALVNDSSCLVISYVLASTQTPNNPVSLHLFGENALKVVFPGDNDLFIQDNTKLCARMAGALCKNLLDIHSSNEGKRKASCEYWGSIFDEKNYTQSQLNELKDLRKLLSESLILRAEVPEQPEKRVVDVSEVNVDIDDGNSGEHGGGRKVIPRANVTLPRQNITDAELVTKSFVMRQDVRSLMKVDRGQHCSIRKWISSQSFSLLALSPQAGKNYVFLMNNFGKPIATERGSSIAFGSRAEDMLVHDTENQHPYSMFDLEQELGLIDLIK